MITTICLGDAAFMLTAVETTRVSAPWLSPPHPPVNADILWKYRRRLLINDGNLCCDSRRADADGDAPRQNTEDHAARLRPRAEGKPPDGPGKAGMSLPPPGKPTGASRPFSVPPQRAPAGKSGLTQRQEVHHQQSGGYSD